MSNYVVKIKNPLNPEVPQGYLCKSKKGKYALANTLDKAKIFDSSGEAKANGEIFLVSYPSHGLTYEVITIHLASSSVTSELIDILENGVSDETQSEIIFWFLILFVAFIICCMI